MGRRSDEKAEGPKYAMVNVRMAPAARAAGNAALAAAGVTPTEAVRALWAFAARHAGDPARVRDLVEALRGEGAEAVLSQEKVEQFGAFCDAHLFEAELARMGLPWDADRAEVLEGMNGLADAALPAEPSEDASRPSRL